MHIQEFQKMMHHLYFERDVERGKERTLEWLEEEVEELREALEEEDVKATEKEFADVFAWLASLANIVDINLEEAALSKYSNKCPKCGLSPCGCKF